MKQHPQPAAPSAATAPTANGNAASSGTVGAANGLSPAEGQAITSSAAAGESAPEYGAFQGAAAARSQHTANALASFGDLPPPSDPNDPPEDREFAQLMDQLAGVAAPHLTMSEKPSMCCCHLQHRVLWVPFLFLAGLSLRGRLY